MPLARPYAEIQRREFHTLAVEAAAERTVKFVASDETVDRYGDVIRVSGWDLASFKKNPVLLFGHDSRQPPIGVVSKVWKEDKQLLAIAKFLSEGVYAFADTVWNIIADGALKAVSVGFMPTKKPKQILDEQNEWTGGYEWVGQELLELSVVPIGANPAALTAKMLADLDLDRPALLASPTSIAQRNFAAQRYAEIAKLGAAR
jgi:HK97 family phage prohead protease